MGIIDNLEGLGESPKAMRAGRSRAPLCSGGARVEGNTGRACQPWDRAGYERDLAELCTALGEQSFAKSSGQRQILPLEVALATVDQQAEDRNR